MSGYSTGYMVYGGLQLRCVYLKQKYKSCVSAPKNLLLVLAERESHTSIHTYSRFRMTNYSNMHVFGQSQSFKKQWEHENPTKKGPSHPVIQPQEPFDIRR